MTRRHGGRDQTPTILLLVEGDSESDYFTMFKRKKNPLSLNIAVAKKHEAKNIVEYCTSYAKFHGIDVEQGDSVHIVIDLDEKTPEQISEIEEQFRKNGFELHLSNCSFEYWLLLHFKDYSKTALQKELEEELTKQIGCKYDKPTGIRKYLKAGAVQNAIRRAEKRILNESEPNRCCSETNPSTTVHILVKKLISKLNLSDLEATV